MSILWGMHSNTIFQVLPHPKSLREGGEDIRYEGGGIACFMAVRKPCPLLNPGSQYDLGRPCPRQWSTHRIATQCIKVSNEV
jgi:hypothetical protein